MVLIKGKSLGDGTPGICVPITEHNKEGILNQAGLIAASEADFVEWRCDLFDDWKDEEAVKEILSKLNTIFNSKGLIFTFRSKEEGGSTDITLNRYIELNRMVIDAKLADIIDVECCVSEYVAMELIPYAHRNNIFVIGSSHDFYKTPRPEEMMYRLKYMQQLGVDIAKIAVMSKNRKDVLDILEMTRNAVDELMIPVITIGMGKMGVLTRICGEFSGSCMTFGALGEESAPGQIEVHLLKQFLNVLHGV